MKIFRKIITILLLIALLISGTNSLHHLLKIHSFYYDYHKYLTEKVDIEISITPKYGGSFLEYPYKSIEEYQKIYERNRNVYNGLTNHEAVYSFQYTTVFRYGDGMSQITLIGLNDTKEFEKLEGRVFTQEEIKSKSRVAIINSGFAQDRNLQVNDKLILNYRQEGLSEIEVEIIGIYDGEENFAGRFYLPEQTLKEINDIWLNEMAQKTSGNVFDKFKPAYLLPSNIMVQSEQDCEEVMIYLGDLKKHDYSYVNRETWGHNRHIDETEPKKYERDLEASLPYTTISFVFLVVWVIFCRNNSSSLEEKYQKTLMKEKEKNVQDIFQMNQETHQLKHDMKHFLIQLSSLIENDDKAKSLEYIKEYYSDIEALEIPVYTLNATLDLLINHYSKKASDIGIDFTYSGNLINELKVNERKLFILLSNALDNAFNHCNENKTVNFSLTYVEPYHRFIIVNNFDKKKEMNQDKEHGYGLMSMKKLVDELQGELMIEEKDNKFICTILIP